MIWILEIVFAKRPFKKMENIKIRIIGISVSDF